MDEKNNLSIDNSTTAAGSASLGVIAIGLSAYIWDMSFNLGAFSTIFLGHYIALWLFSISVMFIAIILDKSLVPGRKLQGYIMLSLPSLWLLLRIVDDSSHIGGVSDILLHGAGALALAVSLPYLLYLFFYFTQPDMLSVKGKPLVALLGIVFFVGGSGYTLGKYNYLIMSCENFIVSGQDTPTNCVKRVMSQ